MLLDKVIYKDHPLAKKLKDNPITDYKPKWTKNNTEKFVKVEQKQVEEKPQKKEKLGFHNF